MIMVLIIIGWIIFGLDLFMMRVSSFLVRVNENRIRGVVS